MFFTIRKGCSTLQRTEDLRLSMYRSQSMALSETLGRLARAAADPAFDGGKLWVMLDFIPFFQSQICAVPVDGLIVLSQQFCRHSDVMDIGWRCFYRMNKAAAGSCIPYR